MAKGAAISPQHYRCRRKQSELRATRIVWAGAGRSILGVLRQKVGKWPSSGQWALMARQEASASALHQRSQSTIRPSSAMHVHQETHIGFGSKNRSKQVNVIFKCHLKSKRYDSINPSASANKPTRRARSAAVHEDAPARPPCTMLNSRRPARPGPCAARAACSAGRPLACLLLDSS